jgi:pimeloyl-ACP methyl ester carboxylesterase
MNERIVEFGPGNRLLGILTAPHPSVTGAAPATEAPGRGTAVVFTNAGIIHRVGANRLHVRLARYLAARGYTSLRYDLPGIGDSDTIGVGSPAEQGLAATRAAFDRLQSMGVADRFVMVGLCSGADHSFAAGVTDPRVAGALLIDPTTVFPTRRHEITRFLRRLGRGLRHPSVIWRILTGRRKLDLVGEVTVEEARGLGLPHAPPPDRFAEARQQAADALTALSRRPVQLFFLLTGHSAEAFTYRRQITDAFPEIAELPGILRVDIRSSADHTFTREADREYLERALAEWLEGKVRR